MSTPGWCREQRRRHAHPLTTEWKLTVRKRRRAEGGELCRPLKTLGQLVRRPSRVFALRSRQKQMYTHARLRTYADSREEDESGRKTLEAISEGAARCVCFCRAVLQWCVRAEGAQGRERVVSKMMRERGEGERRGRNYEEEFRWRALREASSSRRMNDSLLAIREITA